MKTKLLFLFLLSSILSFSQKDRAHKNKSEIDFENVIYASFFTLKIVNLESTKTAKKGDLYFNISHRFGSIKGGIDEFFGLDQSNIRFSFFYGISDRLTLGASRSSFNKTYDITAKYRFLQQEENGFPVTITGFTEVAANTEIDDDDYPGFAFKNRLSYLTEILISKKFNTNLSLEIAPIFIHENFVVDDDQSNSQFAFGAGERYNINGTLSLSLDYVYHFNRASNSPFKNPLSLGFNIEVGEHVFQIILSNSNQLNDINFITSTAGDWANGNIFLGFNLYRIF